MDKPDKLLPHEAKRIILLILEEGDVELSSHCLKDSMPKHHVTMLDVVNTLKTGEILRDPEWDDEYMNWKYRVEGVDIDGDELIAITVIFTADLTLYIITVFCRRRDDQIIASKVQQYNGSTTHAIKSNQSGMEIRCEICGGSTEVRKGQTYHYIECGLNNVYLDNIELRVCKACGTATPRLRRILDLHATIARAVALKSGLLKGAEIRFLRKQLALSAQAWAALLRIDRATLSRWESGDQQIGPQSDALIRLLYFRFLEERDGRLINEALTERLSAPFKDRVKEAAVFVNMDNPALYSYQDA